MKGKGETRESEGGWEGRGGRGESGDVEKKGRKPQLIDLLHQNSLAQMYSSSFLTSANCLDPGTGTKREQRGDAETDIYFSMSALMVGCIIM